MKGSILVTGGAGYIGSHVVRQLGERGEDIIVLDNLSTGFSDAVLAGRLVVGDTGDRDLLAQLFRAHRIEAVLHFAAHTVVPESVSNPGKYYSNNTANTLTLLRACHEHDVRQVIFSSTAAVYGDIGDAPVSESRPPNPINPYGLSKLMSEWMLRDIAAAGSLRYAVLRYFNVAGADPAARLGQSTPEATHLIKVVCEALVGKRPSVSIFGQDYPTPDGTGVRDYIHVEDLASAHIAALDYLRQGGASTTLNCGYGRGYSVREVLDTAEKLTGKTLRILAQERRPGDSASVIADARRIREQLNWTPRYADLELIIRHALAWEQRLAG